MLLHPNPNSDIPTDFILHIYALLKTAGSLGVWKRRVLPNQLELSEAVMNELKIAIILYETGATRTRDGERREKEVSIISIRVKRTITGNINRQMFCLYFHGAKVQDQREASGKSSCPSNMMNISLRIFSRMEGKNEIQGNHRGRATKRAQQNEMLRYL